MSYNELLETIPTTGEIINHFIQNIVIIVGTVSAFIVVVLNAVKLISKQGGSITNISLLLSIFSFNLFVFLGIWN